MAIRQPIRRKMYKTMQGKMVDIEKLRATNENVQAVGNMNVNARGDVIGQGGRVVKTKAEVMKNYYQTPKGRAEDVPNKITKKANPVTQQIQQPRVEQVQTMNPTAKNTQAVKTKTLDTFKPKTKSTGKSGIDAALDGLE